ncbi:carbohydrate ABC transporter permease [Actinopolymorpha pittospori]|uniref:Multiple sugar transport system permease protein n=1 Tax=Actinopolymorpha pittospori TaxID=648752 RepID=A0A927R9V2_9ACTN|nr:sugar ABC transporter permease [Actinopolymorpha pittospori]MBE1608267.1 multiple sugar transport system permease protein [Actinopolymorpha pittospori]
MGAPLQQTAGSTTAVRPPVASTRRRGRGGRVGRGDVGGDRHRPRSLRARREQRAAYLFLLPWFAGLLFITIGPMLASLYLSFTEFNVTETPRWIGFENYREMFTEDPRYWQSVRVTLTYVVISVPLVLTFALTLAVVLNRGLRFLSLYRSLYYLPSLMGSSVAIAILWRQVFGADGLVNAFLGVFGIEGRSWIGDPDSALSTLIALHVWTFGSAMIIFLAGLRQIPTDLYESALIDGAGTWQRFRHITLPLLTPIILFNGILNMISSFQAFTPSYVVSNGTGGPADSTLFYTLYLYQQGFTSFQMGYASAMAWALLGAIAFCTGLIFATSGRWVFYYDGR